MSEETSQTVDTSSEAAATESEVAVEETTNEGAITTYLDGKYESVSALENGYKELQSSYSKKTAEYKEQLGAFSGAPEAYELPEGIDVADNILEYAKENQFSNEALVGLVEAHNQAEAQAQEAYIAEQKELLGKDADVRTKNVVDWAKANLGEDSLEVLNAMVTSAKAVEIFEKIAKISNGTSVAQVATPKQVVDKETIQSMRFATDAYGNRKMSSDPQYRAKVEALEAELYGR